ncbi:MAG: ferritin-like domain-containing protein [Burkholderiaceae bacterium]
MSTNLINTLNEALGWELRAINMYAHFAAIVRGIHRIQFAPMFQTEATESLAHADIMLQSALETETKAAELYGRLLEMLKEYNDSELFDAIEQIYLAELRSIEDLRLITSN